MILKNHLVENYGLKGSNVKKSMAKSFASNPSQIYGVK
jgi:hypothetical protein